MRTWLILGLLAFGVTLAVIIGQRMSTDAMAVVIGVAVGVAASVPTSLLLVALLRRERGAASYGRPEPPAAAYPQLQQPNIIVLNPAELLAKSGLPYGQAAPFVPPPPMLEDGGMRRLRVVGDADDWG